MYVHMYAFVRFKSKKTTNLSFLFGYFIYVSCFIKKEYILRDTYRVYSVERLYCKRPIHCLASSKILTPHPLTARRVCTLTPLVREEDTLARGRRGWGVHNLEDTSHSSVLYVCKYFVVSLVCPHRHPYFAHSHIPKWLDAYFRPIVRTTVNTYNKVRQLANHWAIVAVYQYRQKQMSLWTNMVGLNAWFPSKYVSFLDGQFIDQMVLQCTGAVENRFTASVRNHVCREN